LTARVINARQNDWRDNVRTGIAQCGYNRVEVLVGMSIAREYQEIDAAGEIEPVTRWVVWDDDPWPRFGNVPRAGYNDRSAENYRASSCVEHRDNRSRVGRQRPHAATSKSSPSLLIAAQPRSRRRLAIASASARDA
jgi:hypothetical protein